MDHLTLLIIGSLTASAQAHVPSAPLRWMNHVIMPKGFAAPFRSSSAQQQLFIKNPPNKMSPDSVPYFMFNSDGTIMWEGTDLCIEASGAKSGDTVLLNRCTGEPAQKWSWIPDGHGGNLIQLRDTDECLDAGVEGGFNGAPIVLWECELKGAEAWKFEEPEQSWHTVMNLIMLLVIATLSFGAFLWQYMGPRKMVQTQSGATSSMDDGGISLSAPLAVQMTGKRSGGVVMNDGSGVGGTYTIVARVRNAKAVPEPYYEEELAQKSCSKDKRSLGFYQNTSDCYYMLVDGADSFAPGDPSFVKQVFGKQEANMWLRGERVKSLKCVESWNPRALSKGEEGTITNIHLSPRVDLVEVDFGNGLQGWLKPADLEVVEASAESDRAESLEGMPDVLFAEVTEVGCTDRKRGAGLMGGSADAVNIGTKEFIALDNVHFIDTIEACREATRQILADASRVAVDIEGENLSRDGTIALVQIAMEVGRAPAPYSQETSHGTIIYVFDIVKLGKSAFFEIEEQACRLPTSGGNASSCGGLKAVLEADDIQKIFFDVRADCDALFHIYGVLPNNVIDLQVVFINSQMPVKFPRLRGLANALDKYFKKAGQTAEERRKVQDLKKAAKGFFDPDKGGSYAVWTNRPLDPVLLAYAATDVQFLLPMVDFFASRRYEKSTESNSIILERLGLAKEITKERIASAISMDEALEGSEMSFRDF